MKKRLKRIGNVVVVLLIVLCIWCFVDDNEDDANTKTEQTAEDDWLVCWYLCGSDLESQYAAATSDLQEMLDAKFGEKVTVVIETGGAYEWQNNIVQADTNAIYEYRGDELSLKKELGARNMGEASTLEEFLTYCEENYSASHKMLLFWNHGGGSVSGVSFDENYGYDSLTLAELDEALGNVYGNKEQKLDVVGFDTCLMATVENANVMKKYASYMVASEETEPGNGWEYTGWLSKLNKNPDIDGAALGKIICDTYVVGCEDVGTEENITLSVTDLSKVDSLIQALDSMGNELLLQVQETQSVAGEFARCANQAENYGGNNDQEGYTNMVDLGDLVDNATNLLPDTSQEITKALEECVLYSVNGVYRSQAKGLSVYYSYNGDTEDLTRYKNIAVGKSYPIFLRYLMGEDIQNEELEGLDFSRVETVGEFDSEIPTSVDDEGYLTIQLDPADLDCVQRVEFELAYLDTETNEIIFLGTDNDIDADWDTGVFKDNFRGVWGSIDGNLAYMELVYEGENYTLYSVPITLNDKECYMTVAYLYDSDTYEILGVSKGIDEDTGMADRNLIELQQGDQIVLLLEAMSLEDDSDELFQYTSDPITYTKNTTFEEAELYDGTYAFMFTVKDTKGKETTSDIAYLTYENGEIYAETE
jgi:hypothetical protein